MHFLPCALYQLTLSCACILTAIPAARATVTSVAWYRLGENDPGGIPGLTVTNTTADGIGTKHLKQFGGPLYTSAVSATASNRLGSSVAIQFNGSASQLLSNNFVSAASDNFGFEAWIRPDAVNSDFRMIIGNGTPGFSGWGLLQQNELVGGYIGDQVTYGAPVSTGDWAHVAVVRAGGNVSIYLNGQFGGALTLPSSPGSGPFTVGGGEGTGFLGAIDEVRVFTFAPGQFSTNDLLFNLPPGHTLASVITLPATSIHPGQAILNGRLDSAALLTSYWFEHGLTTNLGSFTATQTLASGSGFVNVSNWVTALPRGTNYFFRAVGGNGTNVTPGLVMSYPSPTNAIVASGAVGSGQPIDVRQPSLELNFIICTNGTFPSRDTPPSPPFLGEVRMFAGIICPSGWTFCHGQSLSVSNNLALWALMGPTYGGETTNYFQLPDLRGRTPMGEDAVQLNLGERGGLNQWVLVPQILPVHAHTLPPPDSTSGPSGDGFPNPNRRPYLGIQFISIIEGIYPQPNQTTFEPFLGQVMLYAGNYAPITPAQGQTLGVAQNTALFSIIGTNFGGNGDTSFRLPDLQGRSPIGIGNAGGTNSIGLGQNLGADLFMLSTNQMPVHRHTVPDGYTGYAGSNQPISLMHPALGLRFLISTNGEMPSTSQEATNKLIGEITLYGGTNVPGGWALCNGQVLSVAAYPALFSVISNRFGGDGVTSFSLPDFSGRVPVGTTNGLPGAAYGNPQTTLTEAQMPSHTHSLPRLDYDRWITSFGMKDSAAAFDGDSDADGLKNGLEWAVGSNPTNASLAPLLTITSEAAFANVHFPRNTNAVDVVFTLQRTTGLNETNIWSGIASNQSGVWVPASVTQTGATNPIRVTVSDPQTNSPSYYRLKLDWP